jgi:hypothetical protein
MKTIALTIASIVFLMAGTANADFTSSLYLGGTYPGGILITEGGNPVSTSGGPISPSTLGGVSLEYVYCIDLYTNVVVPNTYNNSIVTNNGVIYNNNNPITIDNASQIAFLLNAYGATTNPVAQIALQVAIWHEEYLNSPSQYVVNLASNAPPAQVADYNNYLSALGSNTGNVGSFYWITPADSQGEYQAQIAPANSVGVPQTPIPGAAWLFGSGLAGLICLKKKCFG